MKYMIFGKSKPGMLGWPLYMAEIALEAQEHWKNYKISLTIDLEEIQAHAEMYNEHCIRVIGSALRNRPDYLDTQSYTRF